MEFFTAPECAQEPFVSVDHPVVTYRPRVNTENPQSDVPAFWTIAELKKKFEHAPSELVPGFFSKNLTMIQGKAGSGKTIIALELVAAYTTSTPFLGKFACNPEGDRPNVAYFDQDNFTHDVLINRLSTFGVDESKVIIPKETLLLDDPASYNRAARLIREQKIGLVILDSIHGFHKLKDRRLDQLREGFKALIDAGTAIVILSHITKSGSADDSNGAEGSGLPAACDLVWGMTELEYGQFKMKPVKVRQAKGRSPETVLFSYGGNNRPSEKVDETLEDKILQFITDAGEKGTCSSAIRMALGGSKDLLDAALIELKGKYYCDGKRGPGSHIWDVKYMPSDPVESSSHVNHSDDDEGELVAA